MLKIFRYNKKNSFKKLSSILDRRKAIQKNQTIVVNKIIQNVKKMVTKQY